MTIGPPHETFLLDSYRFSWPEDGVEVILDRLAEEKDGLKCEMSISTARPPNAGLLREGRFNLSSATTRAQWVRALEERLPPDLFGVDWYALLELVCARSVRRWRQGEPMVDLACIRLPEEPPYLLYPLVVDGAASVIFADGASGKSLLALGLAVSVATGTEVVPGVVPQRTGPVIYWDWEWDAESHAERLQAICAGAGIDVPEGMIYYQHEMASVKESAARMRKRVAETGAEFIIVDSLGFARGGDANSQELTTQTFAALRTLERPVLVLDHVSADGKTAEKSFGSIYTRNSCRTMWRIDSQKEEGKDSWYAALVHTKTNRRFHKPRGLQVHVEADEDERLLSVRYEATDVRLTPELSGALSLRAHLEAILRANGRPMPIDDLITCLEAEGRVAKRASVEVILSRTKGSFISTSRGWALRARTEAN